MSDAMASGPFDEDLDTTDNFTSIIEDVDHVQQDEVEYPAGSTWGVTVSSGDLHFKLDLKTIRKVPIKSLKRFDGANLQHFRDIIAEFKLNGIDSAISKFGG